MEIGNRPEESNVDHFLITTRDNQFLLIFIDHADLNKDKFSHTLEKGQIYS